jgi:hypothetical protein
MTAGLSHEWANRWSPPLDELQRHLTAALAVLLREPALTIDASTIRMLAKHKERRPVKRDEKGRWRNVQ